MVTWSFDRRILEQLDTQGGFTTGQVAKKLGCPANISNASWSARVGAELRFLQRTGHVRALDDMKPEAWVKIATEGEA